MKFLKFKFIIILLYLISSSGSYAIQDPKLKNLFIHKNQKKLENVNFKNIKNETVYLDSFKKVSSRQVSCGHYHQASQVQWHYFLDLLRMF